jgi:hypothetical protein
MLLKVMLLIKHSPRSILHGLMIMLLLLMTAPANAKVSASLSNNKISLDQPVQLILQIEGDHEMTPDLGELEQLFEIIGRSTQQSISIINGNMSAKRSLSLTLLPRESGNLLIPSIRIGNESTKALMLEVVEQPQDEVEAKQEQVMVELSLNKSQAYIEEEVILTLKLFQAPGIRGESLDKPQPSMPDTQLKLLHEERYTSERNGKQFNVLEQKYALFSYQSGKLEFSGVKYRGRSGGDRLFSLFNEPFNSQPQETRIFRSESNSVELEVMPIPETFTGKRWLPAKNLQIVESGIDQQTPILAGKPLMRRIMVLGDGLSSAQLPTFEQELPSGIKLYEERPQLTETPTRTGISSSRQTGMTLIATEPGQYHLPAIEIPWWNTETDRQEIARLAPITVEIMPNPGARSDPQQPQPLQHEQQTTAADVDNETITADNQPPIPPTPGKVHWLVWLFGIAWVLTLFAWWYTRRKAPAQSPTPLPVSDEGIGGPDKQAMVKAIQQLVQAYEDKDAAAARAAWLDWAQLQWPETPPHNLSRLSTRCDHELSDVVRSLERTLYSPTDETGWADYEILELIQKIQQEKRPEKHPQGLVPLNP